MSGSPPCFPPADHRVALESPKSEDNLAGRGVELTVHSTTQQRVAHEKLRGRGNL